MEGVRTRGWRKRAKQYGERGEKEDERDEDAVDEGKEGGCSWWEGQEM